MTNNPIETKAYLWREGDRWVIGLELSGWLAHDFVKELEGHILTELNTTIDLNNPNVIELVQMPLSEQSLPCPNCATLVQFVTIPKKPRGVLVELWRKLWNMK